MRKLIIFLCLGLMGCPALQSRNELKTADGRFAGGYESREPNRSKNTSTPKAAEQASEYQSLLEEVRRLNGQVEELQHRLHLFEQNNAQGNLSTKVEGLEKRIIAYGETLLLLEGQMNQRLGAIASAPSTPKNDDPFGKAEALFKKSDWKNAILEFNKYRDNFPKGKNYSEATYKIGVCFQELNMKDEARAFYTEVIEKFPKSKSARSAKYRLNQLKK